MQNVDFENKKKTLFLGDGGEANRGHLVNGELGAEMVDNVIGGRGEAAGVGENQVRSH